MAVNHSCSDGALNDRIIGCLWGPGVSTIARMKIQYPNSFSAPLEVSSSEKKILQLDWKCGVEEILLCFALSASGCPDLWYNI